MQPFNLKAKMVQEEFDYQTLSGLLASYLEFGQSDEIIGRLKPQIQTHIAHCFEQLCRNYVQQNASSLYCLKIGRQWATNYEIDVARVNTDCRLNVIGECKYLLFSHSGFTDELEKRKSAMISFTLLEGGGCLVY